MAWEVWSSATPILLTVFGVVVTVTRNVADRKILKAVYVTLFISLGIFAFYADRQVKKQARINAEIEKLESDKRYGELGRKIYGGDNFPYIVSAQTILSNPTQLRVATGKNSPLYNVEFYIHPLASQGDSREPSYWNHGTYRKSDYLPAWGGDTDIFLPLGDWRVELNARNGHWIQIIHFTQANSKLIFHSTVMKDGAIVFDTNAEGDKK